MPNVIEDGFHLSPLNLGEDASAHMAEVCERVAAGESLGEICKSSSAYMPHKRTIQRWAREIPAFGKQLNAARKARARMLVDEAKQIADTPQLGVQREYERIKTVGEDGKAQIEFGLSKEKTADMIEHRKLQISTRLRIAEMEDPESFSPRIKHEVNINIGDRIRAGRERAAALAEATREYQPRVIEHRAEETTDHEDDEFNTDE